MSRVFVYGSLVADLPSGSPATLNGYRKTFGVAADNERAIPGYKRYLDADGSAPPVMVAFLDIAEDDGASVGGVVADVGDGALADLDRRERNYERVDVSALIDPPVEGPVWAYVGSADGRERLARGRAEGRAVITRAYLGKAGFPDREGLPVRDLRRIDL